MSNNHWYDALGYQGKWCEFLSKNTSPDPKKAAKYQAYIWAEKLSMMADMIREKRNSPICDEIEEIFKMALDIDRSSLPNLLRSRCHFAFSYKFRNISMWTFTEWAAHWLFVWLVKLPWRRYMPISEEFLRIARVEGTRLKEVDYMTRHPESPSGKIKYNLSDVPEYQVSNFVLVSEFSKIFLKIFFF